MNYLLKITLIFLSSPLLTGCQSENLQTYLSNNYSLQYPNTYTIEEATESSPFLTIQGEKGRVEIFKHSDFDDPLSTDEGKSHDYSSSGLDEYEAKLVPKEKLKIDGYDVWLFYLKNDEQTKMELRNIYESIEVK